MNRAARVGASGGFATRARVAWLLVTMPPLVSSCVIGAADMKYRNPPPRSTAPDDPWSRSTPAAPAPRPSAALEPSAEPTPASAPHSDATEPPKFAPTQPGFPPHDVAPPHEKSAAPGDGHWAPFGSKDLREPAATEPPIVVRTVLHPHPDSKWITVTIAAMDLSRVAVRLVAGTEDLAWAKFGASADAGLVPAADRDALVLVMNGGFQPKHGHWGLVADSLVVAPPRDEGCSLALYGDGSVRLAPWPALASTRADMKSLRQTPPCLVTDGNVHPALIAGSDKQWAGHAADLTTRRRSAIGLDASGHVLFYAIGEEADPRWLAEALRAAGAASAAELDINWYWTRFLLFGDGEGGTGPLQVTSTLIPKMEHLQTSYVEKASTRDFLYVVRRP